MTKYGARAAQTFIYLFVLRLSLISISKNKCQTFIQFHPQAYNLAKDTVVLLLESNPDIGQLLEWVIDRCYTAQPLEADACFLSLAAIFCARYVHFPHYLLKENIRREIGKR